MKVLVCSDIHESKKAMKKLAELAQHVELIICCGDFTIFGHDTHGMLHFFNSFKKPVLMLQGNHEEFLPLGSVLEKYKYLFYIHKKHIVIGDYVFMGYSTDGFSYRDKGFEQFSPKFIQWCKKYNDKKRVLITHPPPFGTKADLVIDQHVGSKSIRMFLSKVRFHYHFCGHIHEGARTISKIKDCIVINPGAYGMIVDLV